MADGWCFIGADVLAGAVPELERPSPVLADLPDLAGLPQQPTPGLLPGPEPRERCPGSVDSLENSDLGCDVGICRS